MESFLHRAKGVLIARGTKAERWKDARPGQRDWKESLNQLNGMKTQENGSKTPVGACF